jgi:hypothetical protein
VPAALTRAAAVQGQGGLVPGMVVALQGTPHLFIADAAGGLPWARDTRALADRSVTWGRRVEVGLDHLQALLRGDPWLSAGLLKDGAPIDLVKWEPDWLQPNGRKRPHGDPTQKPTHRTGPGWEGASQPKQQKAAKQTGQ